MLNKINDKISYVHWSEGPLSSDVIIIKGINSTFIYDVGMSDEAYDEINKIEGHKNIVLSHFHADHIGNMKRLMDNVREDITLYVSKQTFKYTNAGIIVDNELELDDDVRIKIIPIPSSHSKGCLALEVNDEWLFLGDSIYPKYKDGKRGYNIQLLKAQIDILNRLSADKFYLSHDNKVFEEKRVIVTFLESIYAKRNPKDESPFLYLSEGINRQSYVN